MRVAYVINQYPMVSHSFIRREIQALERLEMEVLRVSVRRTKNHVDPLDQAEAAKTFALLDSPFELLLAVLTHILVRPFQFWRSLLLTIQLWRRGDKGLLVHFAYLAEACRLSKLVRVHKIDHLHAHFGTNSTTVAMLAHLLSGVPYSFTVHGPEEFDRPAAIGLSRKIALAKFVVAISSFGRSQLMRWCPQVHWDKLQVVRCGVDRSFTDAIEQEPQAFDDKTLVCVGRLCEQKGQLLLVDAMAQLRDQGIDAKLILAGDGEMRDLIEERIGVLRLNDRIQITGWLSGAEVRHYLLKSRAMVLPSFAEGLPVVIMEAFALGRPVLTTYIAGIPELVEDTLNGWLVAAGSTDQLVDGIRIALETSRDSIESMGRYAQKCVSAKHDSDKEARILAKHFRREELENNIDDVGRIGIEKQEESLPACT